jgi:hypothetical protein
MFFECVFYLTPSFGNHLVHAKFGGRIRMIRIKQNHDVSSGTVTETRAWETPKYSQLANSRVASVIWRLPNQSNLLDNRSKISLPEKQGKPSETKQTPEVA